MAVLALATVFLPNAARAQLRPLDGFQWRLYQGAHAAAELGVSRLEDQRASLAGESGRLWEIGEFVVAWRTGRVVLEAAGTPLREFRERRTFTAPYADVKPSDNGRRHDSGDYRIATTVRLTSDSSRTIGVLRFGTRLPTTDNTTGLERDAVDFFATVGAAAPRGAFVFTGETGLGIHSTRNTEFEQDDLLLYSLRAEYRGMRIIPSLVAEGQAHGPAHHALRGLENLGELRAGLSIGSRYWVRAEFVRGYETFSPSSGIIITGGLIR